jgi:uncharacterized protein with PIN domain
MNLTGKDKMSKKIATTIEYLIKRDKEPISGEGHKDAEVESQKHQALQNTTSNDPEEDTNECSECNSVIDELDSLIDNQRHQISQDTTSNDLEEDMNECNECNSVTDKLDLPKDGQKHQVLQDTINNDPEEDTKEGNESNSAIDELIDSQKYQVLQNITSNDLEEEINECNKCNRVIDELDPLKVQKNEGIEEKRDDNEEQEECSINKHGSTLARKDNNRNQENKSQETTIDGMREEENSVESQPHNIQLTSGETRGHILGSKVEAMDGNRENGENNVKENEIVQVEVVTNKKHENGIRTMDLRRSRKIPTTRSEDFLWTINCKKHPR